MKFLVATVAAAAVMLVLDAIWLTLMASTYRRHFDGQLLESFRLAPAVAFYFIYILGLMVLVVAPALEGGASSLSVGMRGALLGLVAYGTYALTNYATLKVYSPLLAAMDLCWGPVLTAASAMAAVAAARKLGG